MFFISYIHFLASLVYLALGILVLIRDPHEKVNRVCTLVFLCFFLWSFSYTFVHNQFVTERTAAFFENIGSIGWIFYGPCLLWFSLYYARKERYATSPVFLILLFILPLIFQYKQFTDQILIKDFIRQPYGWLGLWQKSIWPYLFFSYYFITSSFSMMVIWKHGKKSKNLITYRQSMILVISAMVSIFGGSLTNVVFVILGINGIPSLGDIFILSWAGCMTFAILRYKLLSISPVIAAEQIISSMKDLLFLLNPQAKVISCNDAVRNSLEYSSKELEGVSISNLLLGSDLERNNILNSIQLSPKGEFETSLIAKSGKLLPVNLSTSVLPEIGIVCVAHDISLQRLRTELLLEKKVELEIEVAKATKELQETNSLLRNEINERVLAVNALEESEQRLRILFEFAPDGIYLLDMQGNFVDGNREMERITGYTNHELIGNTFHNLELLPPLQLCAETVHSQSVLEIPTGPDELSLKRKDGSQCSIEISTYPITIKERKLVLGIARDISQRKKNEEEKKLLKEELHHAQKMEAIGRLAGGIAHDFNNLLCGITGYADLLYQRLETKLPQETKTLQKIIDTTKQASDLTSRLLAFARKGKYEEEAISLHTIVEEVIGLLKSSFSKNISLKTKLNAHSSNVMGDKSQLLNALLNLAVNSRDAMPGGGEITFESTVIEIDQSMAQTYSYTINTGTYVKLSVIDNGTGMDAETKARAFEPFFTTKSLGKGTGLGLASVYGTVKNHAGFIELHSEPGKGTTIVICIPLVAAAIKSEPIVEEPIIKNRTGNILVVEDEPTLREMACEILSSFGYTIYPCASGTEAVEYFNKSYQVIDLVFLDLTMPGLSGAETFRALKNIYPKVKTIITSGHALDDEIGKLLQDGAMFFLKKPYNFETLSEALNSTLD